MKHPSPTLHPQIPLWGALEWLRLWFSYQRYGLSLVGGSIALGITSWVLWHSAWITIVVGLVVVGPFCFGMSVLARWPEKVRATRLADRRRAAGRFEPRDVRPLCGDPCFRVVTHELLVRAAVPRVERRHIVAELRAEVEREHRMGLIIDHTRGIVTVNEDGTRTQYALDPAMNQAGATHNQ